MKKFIAGFLMCFILMVGISYAANNNIFNIANFKILVNGNKYTGTKPAVVIDGSTYLPLRALGEVLGTKVNWNEDKRQVEIGEAPQEEVTPIATPTPTETTTLGKNEFIEQDHSEKLKVSVIGKISDGTTISGIKYEVWKFKFENITNINQHIIPNELGWNQGAIQMSIQVPEGEQIIKQVQLSPGETFECVAVLSINSPRTPLNFYYGSGGTELKE